MSKHIIAIVGIFASLAAEDYYLKEAYPGIYSVGPSGMSKAYGAVLLVNVVFASIFTIMIGFMVGASRRKCMEEAQDAGDKEAEARFMLPKMQAEGFSATAAKFNQIQRGHQQILESFQVYLITALIGGWEYPVVCAAFGLMWIKGRKDWAEGYKISAKNRYDKPFAMFAWYSLFAQIFATGTMAVKVMIQ
jgi:hypothetical protein